jgi:hypothetical protein
MDTIPTREIAPLKGCREAETIFHKIATTADELVTKEVGIIIARM